MAYGLRILCFLTLVPLLLKAQPTIGINASTTSGCVPFAVNFTPTASCSNCTVTGYRWDFGNGTSSVLQNAVGAYVSTAGSPYTVTLWVKYLLAGNLDSVSTTTQVTAHAKPNPLFSFTPQSGCAPLVVTFTNSTTGSGNSYQWDFGDGTSYSFAANPGSHTYSSPGTYVPTLKVTNSFGCDKTMSFDTVHASPGPTASFTSGVHMACTPPLTVNFTNTSSGSGPLTYNWNTGLGTSTAQNPTVSYTTTGVWDVSLVVTDVYGCTDTAFADNYVAITQVQAEFEIDGPACIGEPIGIDNNSLGASQFSWAWGDNTTGTGSNPTKAYASGGTYLITLTASSGSCVDTYTDSVQIQEISPSFTSSPTYFCMMPYTTYYTNTSTVNFGSIVYHEWHWEHHNVNTSYVDSLGIDTFTRNFQQTGYFDDTLIVVSNLGCTAMAVIPNNVLIDPMIAGFSVSRINGCSPAQVVFTDVSSAAAASPISTWQYNFDNDTIWNQPNGVTHYPDTGCFDPTLTITNALGCVSTMTMHLCFGDTPTVGAIFTEDTTCASDSVLFLDNSYDTNFIDEYIWQFSSNQASYGAQLVMAIKDTGHIGIWHIVGHHGCYDSMFVDSALYVLGPYTEIGVTFDCDTPMTRWCTANVFKGVERFYWDFGDGTPLDSVNQNPVHTYSATGDYTISLQTYNDSNGCSYYSQEVVNVRNLIADFDIINYNVLPVDSTSCAPGAFQANGTVSQDEFGSFFWIFGNDTLINPGAVVSGVFMEPGHHTITMMVRDLNSCVAQKVKKVFLGHPEVDFTFDYAGSCNPVAMQFTTNITSDTNISAWKWSFGDGTGYVYEENPLHYFQNAGTYPVFLEATDTIGCKANTVKPVTVSLPIIGFNVDTTLCQFAPVQFNNESVGNNLVYNWHFGSGSTMSAQENPQFIYIDTGHFTVRLIIQDPLGCVDTAYQRVHVQPKPNADFFADTTSAPCLPLFVTFRDSSISDYLAFWQWDFGDGTGSVKLDTNLAYHTYNEPGNFTVELTVETTYGCIDTESKTAFIQVSGPFAQFEVSPDSSCIGDELTFTLTDSRNLAGYRWIYGDGHDTVVVGTVQQLVHSYRRIGMITPIVIYFDTSEACLIPFVDSVYIHRVKADFSFFPDSTGCGVLNVNLRNEAIGADRYSWDFGDGRTSTLNAPGHYFPRPGVYPVRLAVENDAFGCRDTLLKPFVVFPMPSVVARADTLICLGDEVQLYASADADSVRWQWTDAALVTDPNRDSTLARPDSTVYFQAAATDSNGCRAVDSVRVWVQDTPRLELFIDTTIVIGEVVVLNPVTDDQVYYHWMPEEQFSCPLCPYPTLKPTASSTFSVEVQDVYGCFSKTYFFDVRVEEKYSLDVPEAFTPNGDGINDVIYARGWGIKEILEFRIYNRWGQLVFEGASTHQGWDGTFNGVEQGMDTYAYVVKVLHYNDTEELKEGFIELIR